MSKPNGFQPLPEGETRAKAVTFEADVSDDEDAPPTRPKTLGDKDNLDVADETIVQAEGEPDGEPDPDAPWPAPYEAILRGEFSEFQRFKEVRRKGQTYVMAVHHARLILHNYIYVAIVTTLVVACLFLHNIRVACCGRSADLGFDIAILFTLATFVVDFVLNYIGSTAYIVSFDFWSDISSMVVLVFDLSMVREPLFRLDPRPFRVGAWAFYYVLDIIRLFRLTKLIRLFFLKKYNKKYQYFMKFFELDEEEARLLANEHETADAQDEDAKERELMRQVSIKRRSLSDDPPKRNTSGAFSRTTSIAGRSSGGEANEPAAGGEIVGGFSARQKLRRLKRKRKFRTSRISHRILYLTTKRVLFTFGIIFLVLPLLSLSFYYPPTAALEIEMKTVANITNVALVTEYVRTTAVPSLDANGTPLLDATFNGVSLGVASPSIDGTTLRDSELAFSPNYKTSGVAVSIRRFAQIQAILNVIRVLFVLAVYFQRLYAYQRDASDKIMTPIDRLLDKVKLMAKNPSQALHLTEEYREMKNSDLAVIEDVIQKMAYLLVLGFGEAGNSMLSRVLTISKDLNVDFLGRPNTVYAIFGFCDIRSFTDVTEILVDDVLNFVNAIAKIVHTEVAENQGGANKNIGDAFLVTWRLKGREKSNIDDFTRPSQDPEAVKRLHSVYRRLERRSSMGDGRSSSGSGSGFLPDGFLESLQSDSSRGRAVTMEEFEERRANNLSNSAIAELSLISFLRIMSQMIVNPVIRRYNANPRINKGLPGYKVNLGFGLHAGSAIEGAIGSTLKIDMSYLSHNVNMAPRLEGLTKVYKVPLLFTSSLFNMFNTPKLKEICRRIDRIYIAGTTDYYDLFTVDTYNADLEQAYLEGKVPRDDRYNIVIPVSEDDVPVKAKMIEIPGLKSERDLKMDRLTDSYLTNERKLEMSLIKSALVEKREEDDYIPYDEVQRMWEFLISDLPTSVLIGVEARPEVRQRRTEMAEMYMTAVNYYLEAQEEEDVERWTSARAEFERLAEKSGNDVKYLAVYEYMKSCGFAPPADFRKGRQTD